MQGLRRFACLLLALSLCAAETTAQELLRNDGFESGQAATFQAGFVENEIGAVRLEPLLTTCPCVVQDVTLLFGGAGDTQPIGLHIWNDASGADAPGALIYSESFQLTGSNTQLQLIDLSAANVIVPGPFRVGVEFFHAGLPSIANDGDGMSDPAKNFILAEIAPSVFFWFTSATLGVPGDWIIRATVVPEPGLTQALAPGGVALYGLGRLRCRRRGRA